MLSHLIEALGKKDGPPSSMSWRGSGARELEAARALASIPSGDAALMLSLWPELSDWEREVQAPMLALRPKDLAEWMTAGAAAFGVGPEAVARRARERDLSWVGFRENGVDTWKRDLDKTEAATMDGLAPWTRAAVWVLAWGNLLNPLKFCMAKSKSSSDIGPAMMHLFALCAGLWASLLTSMALGDASFKINLEALDKSWAVFYAGWLAWRAVCGLGSSKRRAGYLKYSARPWSARLVRAWKARRELKKEAREVDEMFEPQHGALIGQVALGVQKLDPGGRVAWLREREAKREAAFEQARDPAKAAAKFEAWLLAQACAQGEGPKAAPKRL